MKRFAALILLGLAIGFSDPAAEAGTPYTERMTCPIGGERFDFTTTGSYSTWGSRPDGRPYGSWHFPLDLPECPSNRLIMYKEFTAPELARLEALIARPEYRALGEEAQYYRLHWLMREMGSTPLDYLWALAQAGWQADTPERRTRYLEEFAQGMAALPNEPSSRVEYAMRGRWINALRELGRFDEAAALLARTALDPLRQPLAAGELGEDGEELDVDEEAEERAGWLGYFDMLRRLVERRDARAEPLDAIPLRMAIFRCVEGSDGLDESDRAFCARESEAVEELRRDSQGN